MKITKYEHACLLLENEGKHLVIDPGNYVTSLSDVSNISVVVMTHFHRDHCDEDLVRKIATANPEVQLFGTQEVADKLQGFEIIVIDTDSIHTSNGFELDFTVGTHAVIDSEAPTVQNLSVLVNNALYYSGDSLTPCSKPFKCLAAPSSANWFKMAEMQPLLESSDCQTVFPTHNALWTDSGITNANKWLETFAMRYDKQFRYLLPGESIEV